MVSLGAFVVLILFNLDRVFFLFSPVLVCILNLMCGPLLRPGLGKVYNGLSLVETWFSC